MNKDSAPGTVCTSKNLRLNLHAPVDNPNDTAAITAPGPLCNPRIPNRMVAEINIDGNMMVYTPSLSARAVGTSLPTILPAFRIVS